MLDDFWYGYIYICLNVSENLKKHSFFAHMLNVKGIKKVSNQKGIKNR